VLVWGLVFRQVQLSLLPNHHDFVYIKVSMLYSKLFTKTTKDIPSDETSKNAQLLIRAGFIHKTMAGVYSYLPLGLRVLNNIENIVRKYIVSIGGQEITMNSLHSKSWWDQTGRWDSVDVLFKVPSQTKTEYALAPTHEEQISPIMKQYISSYKDLPVFDLDNGVYPLAVYQVQTKFRDELRAKAGLMRGREFRMKDLYDFHRTKEAQDAYFQLMTYTYLNIYEEMGLKAYAVDASGGDFSDKFSREFQVVCEAGEDVIKYSESTGYACNTEVYDEVRLTKDDLPNDLKEAKSAEVGNIFDLGQKWVKAFDITYTDEQNQKQYPWMGCHGIGTSRCMGVIAEIYSDEKGLKWPENVAPFTFQMITNINQKDGEEMNARILKLAKQIYDGECEAEELFNANPETVLWDERTASFGEKMSDAELIGCPWHIIITKRSLEQGGVELKNRANGESRVIEM
jgi:prolyl-tRNA synthetase